jgi:hypothetical protein
MQTFVNVPCNPSDANLAAVLPAVESRPAPRARSWAECAQDAEHYRCLSERAESSDGRTAAHWCNPPALPTRAYGRRPWVTPRPTLLLCGREVDLDAGACALLTFHYAEAGRRSATEDDLCGGRRRSLRSPGSGLCVPLAEG